MANIPGTNVPALSFGDAGFVAPQPAAVLAGVQTDISAAFGSTLSYSLTTPQGQISASEAALINNFNEIMVYFSNQTNPAFASGRMQDAIAAIYFLERQPAESTVLQCPCAGLENTVIPENAIITDTSGNTYLCEGGGTIPSTGSITLSFANKVAGPIPVPASNQVSIYQAIPGWDSVAVDSGVVGKDVESRAAFEQRRRDSVAGNSLGAIGSIIGAVSRVAGVTDFYGYDNGTSGPFVVDGVTVAANSIYICVLGGVDDDVAQAIISKKGPGCSYTGTTIVTTYDANPLYNAPIPYVVKFQRPVPLDVLFSVLIVNGPLVPADAVAQVQAAIIAAANGDDGGARARIGSTILAARYVTPVALLGSWAQISSLRVGSANTSVGQFTGVIAGTALTASAITGTIAVGQTLSSATGDIIAGTTIVSGAGSAWVVSISQTVGSQAMKSSVAASSQVAARADQNPVVQAANIAVALT